MTSRGILAPMSVPSFRHLEDDDILLPRHVEDIGAACLAASRIAFRQIGSGLLERIYCEALTLILEQHGHRVASQVPVHIEFLGKHLGEGYRADLVVDGLVVLEIKSVPDLHPAFQAQLVTYLRAGDYPLGYVVNFGGPKLKGNIRRRINSRSTRAREHQV